jgi:hypothetical protein
MRFGCRLSPQVLPFGAENESHDNEHRRQLEIILKFSRRATFRFPQSAGRHDNPRRPLRSKALSHCFVERKSSVWKISSERGEDSTGEFITRAQS